MGHHLVGRTLRVLACGAVLAVARQAGAQEPRVIISGGDKVAFRTTMTLPISDDAIRSLIQAHLPEELQQTDARHVTLVIDANDQYVSGKASKAAVISAEGNGASFVLGDSTGAGDGPVIIRRTVTGHAASAAAGAVFNVVTAKSESGDSGVFGSGYSMADVATLGIRRFQAGELGTGLIVVSVVKLK